MSVTRSSWTVADLCTSQRLEVCAAGLGVRVFGFRFSRFRGLYIYGCVFGLGQEAVGSNRFLN